MFDKVVSNRTNPEGHIELTDPGRPGAVAGCICALGAKLGQGLRGMAPADRWKLLAEFWVKALVCAAPSDKVEEHMQHLSQGGELITHLWAMLYHAGILEWKLNPPQLHVRIGWDYMCEHKVDKCPCNSVLCDE